MCKHAQQREHRQGSDTAIYGTPLSGLTFTKGANGSVVVSSAGEGTDTLSNIEFVRAGTQTVALAQTGNFIWRLEGNATVPDLFFSSLADAQNRAGIGDRIDTAPGTIPWSYNASGINLDFLAAGETINLTYTVTATDSSNAATSDDVTITISGANDIPQLASGQAEPVLISNPRLPGNVPIAPTLQLSDPDRNLLGASVMAQRSVESRPVAVFFSCVDCLFGLYSYFC